MCYSAMVYAEHRKFLRDTGSTMDVASYRKAFWIEPGEKPGHKRPRVPRALERDVLQHGPAEVALLVRAWDALERQSLEVEIVAQRKRVADAERKLGGKPTKKAQDDVRIGTDKVARAIARLEDLSRNAPLPRDYRVYPGSLVPVIVSENGARVIKLMRYLCRPASKPAAYDNKFPGTYNARRDSLGTYWKDLFGVSHAVMVATHFYENVQDADGKNRVLEFVPRDGAPMLVACLWSHWSDPSGKEPDLDSFAAITDAPEPEVAAAGHDRTIINIRPEQLDAWLDPQGDLARMQAIFDDKRHPYYEHREAA